MKHSIRVWNTYLILPSLPNPREIPFYIFNQLRSLLSSHGTRHECSLCVWLPLLTGYQSRVPDSQTPQRGADCVSRLCYFSSRAIQMWVAVSLWLICVFAQSTFYGCFVRKMVIKKKDIKKKTKNKSSVFVFLPSSICCIINISDYRTAVEQWPQWVPLMEQKSLFYQL